jgi:hypothetical protein
MPQVCLKRNLSLTARPAVDGAGPEEGTRPVTTPAAASMVLRLATIVQPNYLVKPSSREAVLTVSPLAVNSGRLGETISQTSLPGAALQGKFHLRPFFTDYGFNFG